MLPWLLVLWPLLLSTALGASSSTSVPQCSFLDVIPVQHVSACSVGSTISLSTLPVSYEVGKTIIILAFKCIASLHCQR